MGLPENCSLEAGELVFHELADEATLADTERLYEHTCFVACTNALRPAGPTSVVRFPYPEVAEEEIVLWGGRYLDAAMVDTYRAAGYVLCQLRLPVTAMVGDPSAGPPPWVRRTP